VRRGASSPQEVQREGLLPMKPKPVFAQPWRRARRSRCGRGGPVRDCVGPLIGRLAGFEPMTRAFAPASLFLG